MSSFVDSNKCELIYSFCRNYKHGVMTKKGEIALFSFWDLYILELICLFIYQWFPNVIKPMRVSDFVINWFCKSKESEGNKKYGFGKIFFIFKFFKLFKFRNRFWYLLKKIFLKNYHYFQSYNTFLLNFWDSIKQIWSYNTVTPGILFDMYL